MDKHTIVTMKNPRTGNTERYRTTAEGELLEHSLELFQSGGYTILSCEKVEDIHE